MKRKKIKATCLPSKPPLTLTIAVVVALDYYQASGIVTGILYTLLALIWIAVLIDIFNAEYIDVFADSKPSNVVSLKDGK
jgi:hypothetical protein